MKVKRARKKYEIPAEWIFPAVTAIVLCACIGISFAAHNLPGRLWANWCNRCHDNNSKWLGKPAKDVLTKLGSPTKVVPTDDEITHGATHTIGRDLMQDWFYDKPQIKFTFYCSDKMCSPTIITI